MKRSRSAFALLYILLSASVALAQDDTAAADTLRKLQNNVSIPNTHLQRALALDLKKRLQTQYANTLGFPTVSSINSDVLSTYYAATTEIRNSIDIAKHQYDLGFDMLANSDYLGHASIVQAPSTAGAWAVKNSATGVMSNILFLNVQSTVNNTAQQYLKGWLKAKLNDVKGTSQSDYDTLLKTSNSNTFVTFLSTKVNLFGGEGNPLSNNDQEIMQSFIIQQASHFINGTTDWITATADLSSDQLNQSGNLLGAVAQAYSQFTTTTSNAINSLPSITAQLNSDLTDLQSSSNSDVTAYLENALYGGGSLADRKTAMDDGSLSELTPDAQGNIQKELGDETALQDTVSQTLAGAQDFGKDFVTVANTLGIPSTFTDGVQTAINVASDAVNAIGDFASGNILGSLSAVANLFGLGGGGPDVDTLRFQQIQSSLSQIDNKLNEIGTDMQALAQGENDILTNQQKEMDAISSLSVQVDTDYRSEMASLTELRTDVLNEQQFLDDLSTQFYGRCENGLSNKYVIPVAPAPLVYLDTGNRIYPSETDFDSFYSLDVSTCLKKMLNIRGAGGQFADYFFLKNYKQSDPTTIPAYLCRYELALSLLTNPHILANKSGAATAQLFVPTSSYNWFTVKSKSVINSTSSRFPPSFAPYMQSALWPKMVLYHANFATNLHLYYMFVDQNYNPRPWSDIAADTNIQTARSIEVLQDALALVDLALAQQMMVTGDALLPILDEVLTNWNESLSDGHYYSPFARQLIAEGVTDQERSEIYNAAVALFESDSVVAHNYITYKIRSYLATNSLSTLAYGIAFRQGNLSLLQKYIGSLPCSVEQVNGTYVCSETMPDETVLSSQVDSSAVCSGGIFTANIPMPSGDDIVSGKFLFFPEFGQLFTARERLTDELATYGVLGNSSNLGVTKNTILLNSLPER